MNKNSSSRANVLDAGEGKPEPEEKTRGAYVRLVAFYSTSPICGPLTLCIPQKIPPPFPAFFELHTDFFPWLWSFKQEDGEVGFLQWSLLLQSVRLVPPSLSLSLPRSLVRSFARPTARHT